MTEIRKQSPISEPTTMAMIIPTLNAVVAVLTTDDDDIFFWTKKKRLQNKFSHSNYIYLYSQIAVTLRRKRNKFDDDIQIATSVCR